jgi:uncharacterized repeat protein (TIGR01451 family)
MQLFPRSHEPAAKNSPAIFANNPEIVYWGGPIVSNVHVVKVLWGSSVDPGTTAGLNQFYTDITNSPYFDLLGEYGTVNLSGQGGVPGSNQLIHRGVFDGSFTISPSLCPGGATSCSITNDQIQTELLSQVNAGHLPQPVSDGQGNTNTLYMIYFPPGVSISLPGGATSCSFFGFCAYHFNTTLTSQKLGYGVFPDFSPASACSTGCGIGSPAQNLTSASSHEMGEAVTDILVGSASVSGQFAPPLAWMSQKQGEIGDVCEFAVNDVPITIGSNTYTVQQLWSNMQNACVTLPAHYQLTGQANANPGKPFNVTLTPQSSVDNSTLSSYANTAHFTGSDAQAAFPADYTFVPATDAGTHVFQVTLNTTGSQTISATDTVASAVVGSLTVAVSQFPDLAVTSTHSASFTQGQTGATYTVTVTNVGNVPTTGQVMVVDSLPSDLTPTTIGGTGWNCVLSTLTCTRVDALAANTPYPAITLVVNVSSSAQTPLANAVQVSTSGDLNPTNDTFTDSTVVTQLADLTIFKTHTGLFSQGQNGETYTLTVTNLGRGPTNGTVTVVDPLPVGLSAAAISGTGWSCTLAPLGCTRVDALGPNGLSYPPITVTVNVDAKATIGTLTNIATVSGGGEVITGNDSASDVTIITAPAPDLIATSTHTRDFTQGQNGASYILTVTNAGSTATNGTVILTDNLPPIFTSVTGSGSGWTCPSVVNGPITCTRNDALAPGSSYPQATISFNVSPTAPPSATNVVSVSGGGDLDLGEGSSDFTNIIQLPDLSFRIGSVSILAAGAIGATQSWIVSNVGPAPTVGLVTFTNSGGAGATPTNLAGPGWSCTLSPLVCTRSDSLAANSSYPPITLTVNYALTATSVTETVNVSGGGEVNLANDGETEIYHLDQPLSISTIGSATATVPAGSPATFTFGVGNLLSPDRVNFACSGLPAGAACNITPPSSTTGTLVTLTITTSGPNIAVTTPSNWERLPPSYALLLPTLGLIAAAGARKRKTRIRLGLAALAILLTLQGCGGGSSPPPRVVTPPGTYTINFTATDSTNNAQASLPVTLIVQ